MPVPKAKKVASTNKVQAAKTAVQNEAAQSAAPAISAASILEEVTAITAAQRAKLEGTTLRPKKEASPIPEIDSTPAEPQEKQRRARKKATEQVTAPEVSSEPTPVEPPKYKGPSARRKRELDLSQHNTNANQNLTAVKAGPRRSSSAERSQVELSATNLGYLDGFISQQPQPKGNRSANTLSAGYSLDDRRQATAAMSPSSRRNDYDNWDDEWDEPDFDDEPDFGGSIMGGPIMGAPLAAPEPVLAYAMPEPVIIGSSMMGAPIMGSAPAPKRRAPKAKRAAAPAHAPIAAAMPPSAALSRAAMPSAASTNERSFLDNPLSPEIELMVIDERFKDGEFPLPTYESDMAAGIDLRAMVEEEVEIAAGGTYMVPTGIALHMGKSGMCATVLPRSGLGYNNGIVLGNLVGLIDADYQGELMVPLWNRSKKKFTITVGMRIAQLVFLPIIRPRFKQVEHFTPTKRGTKGFGSTDSD